MDINYLDNQDSKLTVSDKLFAAEYNEPLIHQVVTACLNNLHAGTKAQKSRAQVRGGGRKPWRQKGTGRARAGTIRSPIWRGGGVTFAARPQVRKLKMNKKMYQGAMRSIIAELNRRGDLQVLESFTLDTHKTKDFLKKLQTISFAKGMIVVSALDENLYFASRNVPGIEIIDTTELGPVDLLRHKKILFVEQAVRQLEELLS